MGIPRLISIFLLALGLYLLGQDVANFVNGAGGAPQPLEAVWRRLDSSGFYAAQDFVTRHLSPDLWDGGVAIILRLPAWTLPISIGVLMLIADIFSQRRSAKQH